MNSAIVEVHRYEKNGSPNFSRTEIQRIIGTSNRGVFRKQLVACGIDPDNPGELNWKQIEWLVCLKLFLGQKKGRNAHTYWHFAKLREKKLIFKACRTLKLRPRLILEQIKHEYYRSAA